MPLTITAITRQQKSRDRINVFINHEYAFSGFSAALAGIKAGDVLTEAAVEAFKRADEEQMAYSRTLRFLALRSRSRKEIVDYLNKKRVDDAVIERILGRLESNGYLDDAEFARTWIENRRRFKPKGRFALTWELKEKGIDEDLIREYLNGMDEEESAWSAVLPRLGQWRNLEQKTLKEKIARFLGRRGFEYDICRQIYERIIKNWQTPA